MSRLSNIKIVTLASGDVDIPLRSVYRYMGLGRAEPDETLAALVEKSLAQFRQAAHYAACYLAVALTPAEGGVMLGPLFAPGQALAKNLAGCGNAVLFAATTGMETERQRKRAAVSSPAQALVLDAVGTAAVEAFCDLLCERFAEEHPGSLLRPRFSPGYGDLPLAFQKELLELLESNRNAGISLTDAMLMIPQKSVSAIAGIGKTGCVKRRGDCMTCNQQDCEFRLY